MGENHASVSSSTAKEITSSELNEYLRLWDDSPNSLAPLTEYQKITYEKIADELRELPYPSKFAAKDRLSNPMTSTDETVPINSPIRSFAQFQTWFNNVTEDLDTCNFDETVSYLKILEDLNQNLYKDTLSKVDDTLSSVHQLKMELEGLNKKISPLHSVCENYLEKKGKLSSTLNLIEEILTNFRTVESIKKRLEQKINVTGDSFVQLLNDIDDCIKFFQTHEEYMESAKYLVQTRHCLAKALSHAKAYIVETMSGCLSHNRTHTSLNSRLKSIAIKIRPLIYQLEYRSSVEYAEVLLDCERNYLSLRENCIQSRVNDILNKLSNNPLENHCSTFRSTTLSFISLCKGEYDSHKLFFAEVSDQFQQCLQSICATYYDSMRPVVIHMKHVETLAELCSILKNELLSDHLSNKGEDAQCYVQLMNNGCEQLLQDIQERLVFRAYLHFSTDIADYLPAPGDLAYPDKLEIIKDVACEMESQGNLRKYSSRQSLANASLCSVDTTATSSKSTIIGNSSAELYGMWYPPVRRTLLIISRLYRCLEKSVFKGLAGEAIACCILSVEKASQNISATKGQMDGHLFQIMHLLILREQISSYQVDFTVKEMSVDLTGITSAAYKLLQKLDASAELVKEKNLDSRKIVDMQLKSVCEIFINEVTRRLTSPLSNFLEQAKGNTNESGEKGPTRMPGDVQTILRETMRSIKMRLPEIQKRLALYLNNTDTQAVLYRPIKNNVANAFLEAQEIIRQNYSVEDQLLIGCPTTEEITALLSSTLLFASRRTSSSHSRT